MENSNQFIRSTPKVYVSSYHKYNSGSLDGNWVNLEEFLDKSDFINACICMMKDENDPELMFQDYENIPELFISESSIDERFWEYLNQVPEHHREPFDIYLENFCGNALSEKSIDELYYEFQDKYYGDYTASHSPRLDFATELFDDIYLNAIPENIRYYIDYEKFARDLFINDYWEEKGYVFINY